MSALCLSLFSLWLWADDKPDENAEVAAIKKQYLTELEPIQKRYRTRLENLKDKLTKKGDLQGALAVKAELDQATIVKPKAAAISAEGTWSIKYDNGAQRSYVVLADGTVNRLDDQKVTAMRKEGNDTLLDFNDGRLERITVKQTLMIEHYNPGTLYAAGAKCTITGIGERTK
jgi:hypothetical protein